MKLCIDGRLFDADTLDVDPSKPETFFSDGVDETVVLRGGRPRRFEGFCQRIAAGARALNLSWTMPPTQLQSWIARLSLENRDADGAVRVLLGRARKDGAQTIVLATMKRPSVDVVCAALVTETARSEPSAPFTRLAHPERLAAVEALRRHDAEVAIILNTAGRVAGAITGDVFALIDGAVVTPPLPEHATGSLSRADVMRLAQAVECPLTVEMLRSAQEWAIADGIGFRPVIELDGVPVGGGELGLITSLLAARI